MKNSTFLTGLAIFAVSTASVGETANDYPYQPPAAAPGYDYQQYPQNNDGYPESGEYIDDGRRIIRRDNYYNGQPQYPGNYPGYNRYEQPYNNNPNVLNDPSRGAFRYYNGYRDTFRTPPSYAPAPGYGNHYPPPANAYPQNPQYRGNWIGR